MRALPFAVGTLALALTSLAAAAPPTLKDPELQQAVTGVPGDGPDLLANFETSKGTIECRLFYKEAPKTVANFAGLATGNKPFTDPNTNEQVKGKRYFDGLIFH
ncbi:MAG: peptidylprolyl isomerase, partial [Myxococcales bacterium]|nr:peptidylprolyl isomerase [Myxococcales bacterium]